MPDSQVRTVPVTTRKELKDFIMFPFEVYRSDPLWVPPLINERFDHFDPHHNPFYDHAEVQLFRAVRDGKTVGRIAAINDEVHPRVWNEPVGFFGEFECFDDSAVAKALFDTVREWLAARGREIMRGPMNMNINDEIGLLIDGRDGPPVVMMTYNPAYYERLIEENGFSKAKDLHAYKVDIASYGKKLENLPERITRVAKIAQERYGVTIRRVDMKHLADDVELIKPIHRGAWDKNWGALPMTDREYDYLADNLRQVVDPDMSYLAFIDGEPVGAFITLPDYCQAVHHIKGRLFPFGWLRFLLDKRKINGIRVLIMGVLEQHRLKGIESLFYSEACRVAVKKGIDWAEMSWILEDNYKVRRGIEMMGGVVYRTYRIYDAPVS